jgi:hypothetical protein
MAKQNAYQVRYTINKKGYKSHTISGIVLAKSQAEAVLEANAQMHNITKDEPISFKLLSATKLAHDFFFIVKESEVPTEELATEELKTKQ